MSAMSRNKGKRGELEFSKLLSSEGFAARRGQQFCGSSDSPDVVCEDLDEFHIEVKRTERLDLYGALEQARTDKREGRIPIVAHRKNDCDWVVIIEARDFLNLVREAS